MNNNGILIMAQAFYGNRTMTKIDRDDFDMLMLGILDRKCYLGERIDRTFIPVPGSDNVVFVYNKYKEKEQREYMEKRSGEKETYKPKPLAEIPELGIKLYSRVLVCRISPEGELESLEKSDLPKFVKYLAK